MGEFNNQGLGSLTVYGNPESFKTLIRNHGQLCKIKQAIACPCLAANHGSPNMYCTICNGDGYIYTYQRHFLVVDEDSPSQDKILYPFWTPVTSVIKAQNVTSDIQGGITDLTVDSFSDSEITCDENLIKYEKKRITYTFDGWTHVESEQLVVDARNKLMYAGGTLYDAGYQSSNPINAFADIAHVIKIWNIDTGVELTNYTIEGNTISTTQQIVEDKMYIEYYYADLTQVISNDITTRDNNEVWTHSLSSGEVRLALYPFWDIAKGDLFIFVSTVLYKNEIFQHVKDIDRLSEIEIYDLNNIIIDEDKNTYVKGTDYILQGRHVKWISTHKPEMEKQCSVRYGYKPSFVVFEDNVQPNNLENKIYPRIVMAKSYSKLNREDIARLSNNL